jgi:hypothetical protein
MRRCGVPVSPLESDLSEDRRLWLVQYLADEYNRVSTSLNTWRQDLAKWERRMADDYEDRQTKTDVETSDFSTIFAKQNNSLGMVAGFCDFAYAQAKDDILGGDEWLAVSPVGSSDHLLADKIRKHAPWKLEKCGILSPMSDGLRLTPNLGTAFLKVAWQEKAETLKSFESVLHHQGQPVMDAQGLPVTSRLSDIGASPAIPANPGDGVVFGAAKAVANAFLPGRKMVSPEGSPELQFDAAEVDFSDIAVERTVIVKNGVEMRVIDHNDIAFDLTAPELDLFHTPVFERFKIGVLDAIAEYDLDEETATRLRDQAFARTRTGAETARGKEESAPDSMEPDNQRVNAPVTLIEAYLRCDPLDTGRPVRIYAVFAPEIDLLVRCDYLANVTPDGALPIFPLRWWKTPNRITGRGYQEVYEDANDQIDGLHNAAAWRDRFAAQPISGFHRSALDDPDKLDGEMDLSKPVELAEGKSIADFIDFANVPDLSGRSIELMNQVLQMQQMRTGITSASQGELKGVPSANTATGTRDIISRGSTLLKWPIDDVRSDLLKAVSYAVKVLYANQDTDETFNWGEGDARELIELKSAEVQDIDVDVTFELSQTQNQELMQNAQAAVGFIQTYLMIPEPEKAAVRPLFVQLLNCLGFRNAEQSIREPLPMPAVDPATGLPPDPAGAPARMDAPAAP